MGSVTIDAFNLGVLCATAVLSGEEDRDLIARAIEAAQAASEAPSDRSRANVVGEPVSRRLPQAAIDIYAKAGIPGFATGGVVEGAPEIEPVTVESRVYEAPAVREKSVSDPVEQPPGELKSGRWSADEIEQLKQMLEQGCKHKEIAATLNRTPHAISMRVYAEKQKSKAAENDKKPAKNKAAKASTEARPEAFKKKAKDHVYDDGWVESDRDFLIQKYNVGYGIEKMAGLLVKSVDVVEAKIAELLESGVVVDRDAQPAKPANRFAAAKVKADQTKAEAAANIQSTITQEQMVDESGVTVTKCSPGYAHGVGPSKNVGGAF